MSAVVDKRLRESHVFAREEADHYAEPLWVSERLFDALALSAGSPVLDPACGFGRIVRAAANHGLMGRGCDIVPRWGEQPDGKFPIATAFCEADWLDVRAVDPLPAAIVSNPPFKHATRFVELALERTGGIVAFLLPTKWVQGDARSRWLETTPLHIVMPISPRPSIPPGSAWLSGGPLSGGTVDFSWFVWLKGYRGRPTIEWLRREA